MGELHPAETWCDTQAQNLDGRVVGAAGRLTVNNRTFSGGLYNVVPTVGAGSAVRSVQRAFMSGQTWDMTVNGGTTAQSFSVAPSGRSFFIAGVGLEMITSNNVVFNGNAFGGRWYYAGGLLGVGAGYQAPAALANGLLLNVISAGVSTDVAVLRVNEDFVASQLPPQGGILPAGGGCLLSCRFEMRQPLIAGTSDAITWTVRDNLTNNQGIVELRSYAWGQLTA